jgi:serine/threonine protein kinase/formylglycine-generating enzyme required for sulfatase activity
MNSQAKRDPYKLVGTTLERYEIQELVGIGGMGVVYRAQHEITRAQVAIKILRPDLTISNEEGVGFFFEEAAKTVSLNHPSIIKVLSADYTPDGSAYMVMEWLDGQTLEKEMIDHGVFPLQRAITLLEQISDAVAYAHKKGIIHRDLKPGNIMLVNEENGDETIRVLDFGIAKVLSTTIGTNTRVAGTSLYISPEQTVAHSPIDQSTDIYSLGIILYQMLTGQVPFDADTDGQVMDMHRSLEPRPLREIRPDIPEAVEEVVLRAIAKKPLNRFQTATDLARAFRKAAQIDLSEMVLQCVDAQSSEPIGQAEVYLNGKHEGQADQDGWWRNQEMQPRQYLIEIESPRYLRWNKSVELQPDEELTVIAKLERRQLGELIVYSNVPYAKVEIEGLEAGSTDQNGRLYIKSIAAGSYLIKLTHPKCLPAEGTFEVAAWKQSYAPLQLNLRPQQSLSELVKEKIGSLKTRGKREVSKRTCDNCGLPMSLSLKFCTECGFQFPQTRVWNAPRAARVGGLMAALLVLFSIIFYTTGSQGPKKHTLSILTSLPDSGVSIDDGIEKRTDATGRLTIEGVTSGSHKIKVSKPGYQDITQSITLSKSLELPRFELKRLIPDGMVYIPGGTFQMGYGASTPDNPSGPPHQVTLQPYFIDKYEVTHYAFKNIKNTENQLMAKFPMTDVTWDQADKYCRSIGKRLPTEEEWEFAARGTDGRLFPWGNRFESGRANIERTANASFRLIGSFSPAGDSPFGVADLSGNAMEWTQSDFKSYAGSAYRPAQCIEPCKVIRGGAYFDRAQDATAVFRRGYEPSALRKINNAYRVMGFRCVKDVITK